MIFMIPKFLMCGHFPHIEPVKNGDNVQTEIIKPGDKLPYEIENDNNKIPLEQLINIRRIKHD